MYKYEIIVKQEIIKLNDITHLFKIIEYLLNNGYTCLFNDILNKNYIQIEDDLDLAMLKDNI